MHSKFFIISNKYYTQSHGVIYTLYMHHLHTLEASSAHSRYTESLDIHTRFGGVKT